MGRSRKNKEPLTAYDIAKKRVEEKKKFYQHLSTYVVMSIFFYMINYLSNPGHWWFYWPMLGWGVGLLFQYMNAYGGEKNDLVEKEYQKLKNRKS